ncbi:MAG: SpoIIE family protein phosphatase [Anaerolineales bacterium]|nr:SpoIIE family protein phosphatase [Anaerolineales bacterium]
MFRLRDFFQLPHLEPWLDQLLKIQPGMILIAGKEAQAGLPGETILPSGRSAIFHVLLGEILANNPATRAIIITHDRKSYRLPREVARKMTFFEIQRGQTEQEHLLAASHMKANLLILDRLTPESIPLALDAARRGKRVLAQLDTIFWGAGVLRHLLELGAPPIHLAGIAWIVTVQRLPTLCPTCKHPYTPNPAEIERILQILPGLEPVSFFHAHGCDQCNGTGRRGDISVFDLFHLPPETPNPLAHPSQISVQQYALHLATRGLLPLEDSLQYETFQLQRALNLLASLERTQTETKTTLERKLLELQTANRVLEQRTQELISLENVGQTLLSTTDMHTLATVACQKALELCSANRAILYLLRPDQRAEVLASGGWDATRILPTLPASEVLDANPTREPLPYHQFPPGIPPRHPDLEGALLRAGLAVPLLAQEEQVGLMIVHSTRKNKFAPGEVALLQSFANHAALAIQRAGLVEQLRAKIAALEAAQAELAVKERLEREMELARNVQQNVLPRTFPQFSGYQFAAGYVPARFVGGDFYDVIDLGDGKFGLAIADVSDKGMPAALYMTLTRSLLRAEAYRQTSPRAVLARVNDLLMELGTPTMFVTVFYAVLDTTSRGLVYARAGHDRPLLVRGNALIELSGRGTPLGFLETPDFHLSEEEIALEPGDRLVLFTDGMTDVLCGDGGLMAHQHFRGLLPSLQDHTPEAFCAAIFERLTSVQGDNEQFDDMALLVLGVDGAANFGRAEEAARKGESV